MSTSAEVAIRPIVADEMPLVEPMWRALYEHHREIGMILTMPPNAFDLWRQSMASILGRFAFVFLATVDREPAGFVAGRLRQVPAHFGGGTAGLVTELFVFDRFRSYALGLELLDAGVGWYHEHGVTRAELQVLPNNGHAIEIYKRLGWEMELYQMVLHKKPDAAVT